MSGVSKTPKITSWVHTGLKFCPDPSHAFLSTTCDHKPQTRTSDARVSDHDRTTNHAIHHRAHLRTNISEPSKTMSWLHRAGEDVHWTCHKHQSNHTGTTQATSTHTQRPRSKVREIREMFCAPSRASPREGVRAAKDRVLASKGWRARAMEAPVPRA